MSDPIAQPPSSSSGPHFGTDGQTGSPQPGAAGTIIGGKFRIIKELGAGGMGAVYEVVHEVTMHTRALKLLKKTENEEHLTRLLREASAAGRIGNPHIVETYDAGRFDTGEPYILMEHLSGRTLFDYIRDGGGATVPALVDLVCQTCEGLQAAHEAGIVHRDVKPANLFVVTQNGKPFVKILDFGISKFDPIVTDATELTVDGQLLGTPAYMAPEQLRGEADLDRRVDVYALGVMLYTACAGVRPFKGKTVTEMVVAIVQGTHVPLWQVCPDLPESFCSIVEQAMARDRDARFPTVAALRQALLAELAVQAINVEVTMPPADEAQRKLLPPLAPARPAAPSAPTIDLPQGPQPPIPDRWADPTPAAVQATAQAAAGRGGKRSLAIVAFVAVVVLGNVAFLALRSRNHDDRPVGPQASVGSAASAAPPTSAPAASTAGAASPSVGSTTTALPPSSASTATARATTPATTTPASSLDPKNTHAPVGKATSTSKPAASILRTNPY
jgi:eukaryotic-like serine/threonine-protein kinase